MAEDNGSTSSAHGASIAAASRSRKLVHDRMFAAKEAHNEELEANGETELATAYREEAEWLDELLPRLEEEEADRERLKLALVQSTQAEFSNARRMREAIVEARRRLAKGRGLWNGPCHECDGVLEQALSAFNDGASPAAAGRSREVEIVPTYWCSFCGKTSVAERDIESGDITCPTEGCTSHE